MRHLITLISSIHLLSACGESERNVYKQLCLIDSLANTNPDSAMTLLGDINHDLISTYNHFYLDLLTIKARDKAFITHASDSSIISVINYFEKNDNNNLLPIAYYYGGRVYADLGDAPQALEYFQKALDCENINLHTMTVAYSQIAQIYNKQDVFELAIPAYQKAIKLNNLKNDTIGLLYNMRNLGEIYFKRDQNDSALILYEKSLQLAEMIGNEKLISSTKLNIAEFYLFKGDYTKSMETLSSVKSRFPQEDSTIVANTVAHLYYRLNNEDSTIHYCNKLINSQSFNAQLNGYNMLVNLYLKNRKNNAAYDMMVKSASLSDSISKIQTPHKIRLLSSIYNYQIRERENHKLKQSIQAKEVKILLLTSSIVVVLIIAIFIISIIRKRKRMIDIKLQNVELLLNQRNNLSELVIAQNKEKISFLESQINSINSENKTLIQELENQKKLLELNNEQAILIKLQNDSALTSFNNDPFITEIRNRLQAYPDSKNVITENEWITFTEKTNQLFPEFINVLNNLPFKLSLYEFRISILIKTRFSLKEISRLTNHSDTSVSMTRSRLHKKLTNTSGHANDWDKFIKSI